MTYGRREARTGAGLVMQTRYVRIHVRRQSRWQLLFTQLTALNDSSSGAVNKR